MADTSSAKQERGPFYVARRGSAQVPVYAGKRTVNGREYDLFTVSYYEPSGKRVRRTFGQADDARKEADRLAGTLAAGQHDAAKLTANDASIYFAAVAKVKPRGLTLTGVVDDYLSAIDGLPPGARLGEAVTFYADRHPANAPKVSVAEAVKALIEDRTAAKCSAQYVGRLETELARFSADFACNLASVNPPQVADWLRGLRGVAGKPVGNRTRRNFFGHIRTLFMFALTRRWVSRDLADEVSALPQPRTEAAGEVGIFTPAEIRTLLENADAETAPLLAIGAFAGLRTAEICRLEWQDVRLAERVVIIGANKAKTASRRVVPIADNLAAWLAPYAQREGLLAGGLTDKVTVKRWDRLADRCGIEWRHNALRHSFCSYRVAVTQDPAKVAFEAGNSPQMIHQHYRALVTEAQGRDWFNVAPPKTQADVIPLPMQATG